MKFGVALIVTMVAVLALFSDARAQTLSWPVPRGTSVAVLSGGDGATVQEAHRIVKDQGWIESSNAEYVVVVVKSDRRNPLTRLTYDSSSALQRDISIEGAAAGAKTFHCYLFEIQEMTKAADPPGTAPESRNMYTLQRIAHDSWDAAKK